MTTPVPTIMSGPRGVPVRVQLARFTGATVTFFLAAAVAIAPMLNAIFPDGLKPIRLAVVLVFLLGLHLLRHQRIYFPREAGLYLCLLAYMTLSAAWTPDRDDGVNTLVPGANFLFILMLVGSLATIHNLRATLLGLLCGFLAGAMFYTRTMGFPLVRPEDFSYNAIAGMYLMGLIIVLLWGWYTGHRYLCMGMSVIVWLLIAATTSIKTNLGVVLGAVAGGFTYLKVAANILGRSLLVLLIAGGILTYIVLSNDALQENVVHGFDRVNHGVEILSTREDVAQDTSYNDREDWKEIGLTGWKRNPVFGYGAEAFRADVGITSHSTPIDVMYNFGLIGLVLFYALFASVAYRLYALRKAPLGALPVLVVAGLTCYLFMSIAAPLHYNTFLAVFIALSSALLREPLRTGT